MAIYWAVNYGFNGDSRMSFTKQQAISSLVPKAFFTTVGDEVTSWLSPELTQPTEAEISAEQVRLQAEYDAQEYARNRKAEYPPIGDQLDALFHAGVFPADMAATLQAVKDKYPND
jgi:hypothetical protein